MTPWARLTLPLATILLGACSDPIPEVSTTSLGPAESSTGEPPPPTTTATTPGEDTLGTMGGTGMETTMGAVDTTAAESTTTSSDETTVGVSSASSSSEGSSEGPPPECAVPGDCLDNNETCDPMGQCVSVCNPWGPGNYDYCLTPLGGFDSATICGEPLTCIVNTGGPFEVAVCGRTCAAQCDCPAPPGTGNAIVTCGDLTGDGASECYLSCTNGEPCPDGMTCRNTGGGTSYCTHPVEPLAMYGDCGAVTSGCANGGFCATATNGSDDWAICIDTCAAVGECDAAPLGAAGGADCGQVYTGADSECHLNCFTSADCLPGMNCIDIGMGYGNFCMWLQ